MKRPTREPRQPKVSTSRQAPPVVYAETSVYLRITDDQTQVRIYRETQALKRLVEQARTGEIELVGSYLVAAESALTAAPLRAELQFCFDCWSRAAISSALSEARVHRIRAAVPSIAVADASYLALAERLSARFFVTCDDLLMRRAQRASIEPSLRICDPLTAVTELEQWRRKLPS